MVISSLNAYAIELLTFSLFSHNMVDYENVSSHEPDGGNMGTSNCEPMTGMTPKPRAVPRPEHAPEYSGDSDIPKEIETGLFRITQEAMNNMAKYARASELHVFLAGSDDEVTLQIAGGRQFPIL